MKKEVVLAIVFVIVMIGMVTIALDRFEKIDNGEMTLVSESYMDR